MPAKCIGLKLTCCSTFFPPVETEAQTESTEGQETSTEPSELLSQLPDAPTSEPKDVEDTEQPAVKKQKTVETDADDDFVVVEKDDAKEDVKEDMAEDKLKPEL